MFPRIETPKKGTPAPKIISRTPAAAITGVLFIGLILVYKAPNKNYDLFTVITMTSVLQTLGLIFSRFFNEFSAQKTLIIDLTIYSAIFVSLYLIYILIKFNTIFKE